MSDTGNSPSADLFQATESGLFVPPPKGKEAVHLAAVGMSQDVEGTLDEVLTTIRTFLSDADAGEWLIMTEPRFGGDVALHRRFLAELQGVGIVWIDFDQIRLERQQRDLAQRQFAEQLAMAESGIVRGQFSTKREQARRQR